MYRLYTLYMYVGIYITENHTVQLWKDHTPTHLCSVVEVPKLSCPTDEGHWVGHGEANIKPKDCVLTERAVTHCVLGLVRGDVGKWSVCVCVCVCVCGKLVGGMCV